MLDKGEKIFSITRRLFDGDRIRIFIGEVHKSTDNVILVRGYAFTHDYFSNEIVRQEVPRIRIISMTDAVNIILNIDSNINIENVQYKIDDMNQRVITDNESFTINLSEFGI